MLGSPGDGKCSRGRGKGGSRMLRRGPRSLRGRVTMLECSLGQMDCTDQQKCEEMDVREDFLVFICRG
jgi:hypothetical protein